jgi:hypothetical protein
MKTAVYSGMRVRIYQTTPRDVPEVKLLVTKFYENLGSQLMGQVTQVEIFITRSIDFSNK